MNTITCKIKLPRDRGEQDVANALDAYGIEAEVTEISQSEHTTTIQEVLDATRIHHDALASAFTNPPPEVVDVLEGLAISAAKLSDILGSDIEEAV